jgi:hypothetical protein
MLAPLMLESYSSTWSAIQWHAVPQLDQIQEDTHSLLKGF